MDAGTVNLCFLAGDADGNFAVAFADFLSLSLSLSLSQNFGHLNGNGRVSFEDFIALSHSYGKRMDPVTGEIINKIA